MFLGYCMVFGMSLMDSLSWRLMLAVISIPSACYLALTILFLPESPHWLVSKGKIDKAKHVLQRLHGREDVSDELALLIEGLGVVHEATIEEYVISPANEVTSNTEEKSGVKLNGLEGGVSWIANPIPGESNLDSMISTQRSMKNRSIPLMDPLVILLGSVHENLPAMGSQHSILFTNTASMLSMSVDGNPNEQSDEENQIDGDENITELLTTDDSSEDLQVPFLSHHESSPGNNATSHPVLNAGGEGATQIGGGWRLTYKYSKKEAVVQRIFLHQEGVSGSRQELVASMVGVDSPQEGEFIQAAALTSEPAIVIPNPDGSVTIRPAGDVTSGPSWREFLEPGVKRALIVGVGLQILQQVSGINGVLYYGPQILEQAGAAVLLSNLGLSPSSAPLFISLLTTLLMFPCIIVSMRLMDVSGRRFLMLSTIPVLIVSLLALLISNITNMGSVLQSMISTGSVMIYTSCFVMGFGVIPNILCAEIFPTRVRGLCITICSLTYWIGNIIVTYSLPVLISSIGLVGVFTIYAIGCLVSWVFVFLKVPETKGMPLEVISEFFALGASRIDQNSKTRHPRGTV